jgi:cellulose synthase/poly-beta-1,6-N-acetylglucosamine synthase-like glycosyltransferase
VIRAVGVVVPVHDEEQLLENCLHALSRALFRASAVADVHAVVVLDACSDESLQIADDFASCASFEIVTVAERNVGRARAIGVDHVVAHFDSIAPSELWIATTDADSRVPKDWLVDHLDFAARGARALAGVVRVHSWHPFARAHRRAYETFYSAFGETERHGHVHGANLGVRADAYLRVGGFPALRTGEDQALVRSLLAAAVDVVATREIEVLTSGRLQGRAPDGFADFLSAIGERVPTIE